MSNRKLRSELEELRKRLDELEKRPVPQPIIVHVPAQTPAPSTPPIEFPGSPAWPAYPGTVPTYPWPGDTIICFSTANQAR